MFPASALLVLLVSIFHAVSEVKSAALLLSAANETVRVLIKNDRDVPLTVRGPGVIHAFQVADRTTRLVKFAGWGDVVVTEDNKEILRERVNIARFIVVRTHSDARFTATLGRISIVQEAERLNLTLCKDGGSRVEHCLKLTEAASMTSQDIRIANNTISITQPYGQKNQNLVFIGKIAEHIATSQYGVSEGQDLLISSGEGGCLTSIRKDASVTYVKQILETH